MFSVYSMKLLMPEWARTRSYRHSSQFSYTKFTGFYRGVPDEIRACWPDAFCCMGNVDYSKNYGDALEAVRRGNVLMVNCWYGGPDLENAKKIYLSTGAKHAPVAEGQKVVAEAGKPLRISLKGSDEDGDAITFKILGPPAHGKLEKLDPKTGEAVYTADNGFKGDDLFSFKTIDAAGLESNRGIVAITVK